MIDLHTHSAFSDGTQTPQELLAQASASGVTTIGLTDHDTVAGWDEAVDAARTNGVHLVRGMEVSCRYEGVSVHMLSYLHNPQGARLTAETEKIRAARITRTRKIVDLLSADFPITWEHVSQHVGEGATVGRPHIADALVHQGIARDRSEAFATLLHRDSPYYVSMPVISPIDAIDMIHEAGGVAVFAHPAASARGKVVPDSGMRAIIEAGLDGLEIDHRDNPLAEREKLRERAQEHGLIVTGSSDYHGAGKPNKLAENTTSPHMLERIVERAHGVDLVV